MTTTLEHDYVADLESGFVAGPVHCFVIGKREGDEDYHKVVVHIDASPLVDAATGPGSVGFRTPGELVKALDIDGLDAEGVREWIHAGRIPAEVADGLDLPVIMSRLNGETVETPAVDNGDYHVEPPLTGATVKPGMKVLPCDGGEPAVVLEVCEQGCFLRRLGGRDDGKVFGLQFNDVTIYSQQESDTEAVVEGSKPTP